MRPGPFQSTLRKRQTEAVAGSPEPARPNQHDFQTWIDRWERTLNGKDALDRRLQWDGATRRTAVEAIGRHWATDRADSDQCCAAICADLEAHRSSNFQSGAPQSHLGQPILFPEIWMPLAVATTGRLRSQAGETAWSFLTEAARAELLTAVTYELSRRGENVLLELFNRQRTMADALAARAALQATGKPLGDRYHSFVRCQLEGDLQAACREFPELARQLAIYEDTRLAALAEVLVRLSNDRKLIEERFGIDRTWKIDSLQTGAGDPHNGGRTVAILTFVPSSKFQTPTRLVYKPRDSRLEGACFELLQYASAETGGSLRVPKLLMRDEYAYTEFIAHAPPRSDCELDDFYYNAGRLLALLHILGCTDCHDENFVASGRDLVLLDAETAFDPNEHPNVRRLRWGEIPGSELEWRIERSVLRTGMLPKWMLIGSSKSPIDISALGSEPPKAARRTGLGWSDANTDAMLFGRCEVSCEIPTSLPYRFGDTNRLLDHLPRFLHGLRQQFDWIMRNRDALLGESGLSARFGGLRRRAVIRPTRVYDRILQDSTSTENLRSSVTAGIALEPLAIGLMRGATPPPHWPIFHRECEALHLLDIPRFEHAVDTVDLELGGDSGTIHGYFETSGLDACKARIESLSIAEIDFQLCVASSCIETRFASFIDASTPELIDLRHTDDDTRCELPLPPGFGVLQAVRGQVARAAIPLASGGLGWMGQNIASDGERANYGALDDSLYSGTTGICLFLCTVHDQQSSHVQESLKHLLYSAMETDQVMLSRWWRDRALGLCGGSGMLIALHLLGLLVPSVHEQTTQASLRLANALTIERVNEDRDLDIAGGCAGLIGPLLNIGTPHTEAIALAIGARLVATQDPSGGWLSTSGSRFTGFAHGSSGIAAALGRLYQTTRDPEILETIHRALRFEQSLFDSDSEEWRAESNHKPGGLVAWCHGAAGIALSRHCLLQFPAVLGELEANAAAHILEDREVASQTTQCLSDQSPSDSLCCGTMGRIAILRTLGQSNSAALLTTQLLRRKQAGQLESGVRDGPFAIGRSLSLFRGASGVAVLSWPTEAVAELVSSGILCPARR
jgi:type 2 lantibiotic biosynthesis protein LanM